MINAYNFTLLTGVFKKKEGREEIKKQQSSLNGNST